MTAGYVAWCDYWNALYGWYDREGYRNVAAYLALLDLSDFDPKAPPPNTPVFWAIVDANRPQAALMSLRI
jgi:hypothetical protein